MDDLENIGGEGGGVEEQPLEQVPKLILKRSDLLTLRKMADRWPFSEGEREELKDLVMTTARTAKSPRLRLSACLTAAKIDERNNLRELKEYLAAIGMGEKHTPEVNVSNNIVLQVVETVVEKQP